MLAEAVETRLASLEAQVRTLRFLVFGFALAAIALSVLALDRRGEQETPAAARAPEAPVAPREVVVVDAESRVRARLGVDEQGAAFLELIGPGQSGGARLVAAGEGARLELRDGSTSRANLGWSADPSGSDRATLELQDRAGVRRAELVAGDAVPALTLFNEKGVASAGVP